MSEMIWTPSEYEKLVVAWDARMRLLRAGDVASATHVWGEAFRAIYPNKGRKEQTEMIDWHQRPGPDGVIFVDCTVAGIMFFEDTVGWMP